MDILKKSALVTGGGESKSPSRPKPIAVESEFLGKTVVCCVLVLGVRSTGPAILRSSCLLSEKVFLLHIFLCERMSLPPLPYLELLLLTEASLCELLEGTLSGDSLNSGATPPGRWPEYTDLNSVTHVPVCYQSLGQGTSCVSPC